MVKYQFLKQFKDKTKNPNALNLLKEIERLMELGNEIRADILMKRYKQRYANEDIFLKISRDIWSVIKKCPINDQDDRPKSEQQYCLYTSDGERLLGRHPSKEKAKNQEKAIQVHKHGIGKLADGSGNMYPDFVEKEYGTGYDSMESQNKVNPWRGTGLSGDEQWKDYNREFPNTKYDQDDYADRNVHEPEMNDNLEYKHINDFKRQIDDTNYNRFYAERE